jgi:hypothetical protein
MKTIKQFIHLYFGTNILDTAIKIVLSGITIYFLIVIKNIL